MFQAAFDRQLPEPKGLDFTYVSRWEHGTMPNEYHGHLLCLAFGLVPAQLDLPDWYLPGGMESIGPAIGDDLAIADATSYDADMERREFMEHLIAALGGALAYDVERFSASQSSRARDQYVIREFNRASQNLARESWTTSPRRMLPMVGLQLANELSLLRVAVGRHRRELLPITCETATLAGRVAWMCDNRGDAARHLRLAMSLARDANDNVLRARVLAEVRNLYTASHSWGMSGSPSIAMAAIDEAVTAAGTQAHPMLRVWLFNLRADEHATQGHEQQAHDDLDEADRAFAQVAQPEGFFQHWNAQRQARFRGGCEVLLGRLADGVGILEAVREEMSPDLVGPYVTTTADLAAAYAQGDEMERAAAALLEALDVAEAGDLVYGGVSAVQGVREKYLRSDSVAVKALDDRLLAFGR